MASGSKGAVRFRLRDARTIGASAICSGSDLVSDPARAAQPELAFRIAGLFWSKKGLNELADRATAEAFREITRRINGGFNGLEDRRKFYAVARTVLGVVDETITRGTARTPAGGWR